jgi:branched-chain amino acid transport system ATP-binding protein
VAVGADGCLAVENLSRHFGGLLAVNRVRLAVEVGERRGILGPNGAGKTTLFNLIAGDLRPSSGIIRFHCQDITRLSVHRRANLGIGRTFQVTRLFPKLTVMDNLLLAAQALEPSKFDVLRPIERRRDICRRAERMLEQTGMTEKGHTLVSSLSYGDQRKLEVALALLGRPTLLLLDEPTAGLSPVETAEMVALLKSLEASLTMLIIEHDMDVAFELTDTLTVMHEGAVIAEGSKDKVRQNATVQEIYLGRE